MDETCTLTVFTQNLQGCAEVCACLFMLEKVRDERPTFNCMFTNSIRNILHIMTNSISHASFSLYHNAFIFYSIDHTVSVDCTQKA